MAVVAPLTGAEASAPPRVFEGSDSDVAAGTGADDVSLVLAGSSAGAESVAEGGFAALFTSWVSGGVGGALPPMVLLAGLVTITDGHRR